MEKILFKKIEVWAVMALLLLWTIGALLFGWLVKAGLTNDNRLGGLEKVAIELASIPTNLKILYENGLTIEQGKLVQKNTQILELENRENFTQNDKNFNEDGILLISAYSKENSVSTVYLYDIRDKKILWQWVPSPEEIVEASPTLLAEKNKEKLGEIHTRTLFRSQHPYLLPDGSIVLTSGEGPLAKINACGETAWVTDRHFHHTIEGFGGNLIVPVVSVQNKGNDIGKKFRDDGYAIVAQNGELLEEKSVISLLRQGGYEGLLFGQTYRDDVVHLNDAEPILSSDEYVKAGDIMLSARNLSTVFLYRPSEDKIIWLKTGPWLNQHDIDYLGGGKFSVFGNDMTTSGEDLIGRKNSNIYVYNMKDGSVSKPYETVFRENKFTSPTEGRQRVLSNGDAFFEVTSQGEMFRASPGQLRWSYRHRISDSEIGAPHWSRYFNRDEVKLDWISKMTCNKRKG